jgi:hypothetical protein
VTRQGREMRAIRPSARSCAPLLMPDQHRAARGFGPAPRDRARAVVVRVAKPGMSASRAATPNPAIPQGADLGASRDLVAQDHTVWRPVGRCRAVQAARSVRVHHCTDLPARDHPWGPLTDRRHRAPARVGPVPCGALRCFGRTIRDRPQVDAGSGTSCHGCGSTPAAVRIAHAGAPGRTGPRTATGRHVATLAGRIGARPAVTARPGSLRPVVWPPDASIPRRR